MVFVPSGGEFRVNAQTGGDQMAPAITAVTDGGFVVVWDDASGTLGDSDGRSIKAQRYDALANPVGGEFLVNTQTVGNQFQQRVTGLTDGRFVVTWTDFSGVSDGNLHVQAQTFSATGTRIGSEFLVNTETASSQVLFDIAALTNGGFVITWDHDGRAKAQVYDASGARVGGEIVADAAPGHSSTPRVAGLPTGGFVVTWTFDNSTILDCHGRQHQVAALWRERRKNRNGNHRRGRSGRYVESRYRASVRWEFRGHLDRSEQHVGGYPGTDLPSRRQRDRIGNSRQHDYD